MREWKEKVQALAERLGAASLPVFFAAMVFLDCAFRWVYAQAGSTRVLDWKPMMFTVSWALLVTCLTAALPRLPRRIVMGVLGGFFAFLVILHGVMFNVFGHFFSFADMNFAGDGAKFFSWTYFHLPKKLFFFVGLYAVMVAAAIVLVPGEKGGRKRRWLWRGIALGAAALCLIPMALVQARLTPQADTLTWGTKFDPNSETEIYREFTDANRSMKLTGLYQYTARNFAVSFGLGVDRRSVEELNAVFEERQLSPGQRAGELKGKNLMLVMLESIDTWLARPEYMPNLCALMEEGVEFERFYTPLFLSAGTFNTEIITQTGLVPPAAGMASSGYSTNAFPLSLANLFAGEGYRVNSFHSASGAIYSRGSVHLNLGFEKYHSYKDMDMEDYQMDSQMINGYWDMVSEDPFYSFLITYSGHGPYTQEMGNISAPHWAQAQEAVRQSGVTGTPENMSEYTHAVAHAMETDQLIGELVENLRRDGLWENTVLLLYADHYGKYMTDKDFLCTLKGVSQGSVELYRTPCVLAGGGLKPEKVSKVVSSVDVVPTIASLFDLPADARYYAGEDMFAPGEGLIAFPNNAWYDGTTYYAGNSEESGVVPDSRAGELKQRVDASMEAVRTDYFKSWEKR